MATNCICTGPVCTCGAEGVVKDGAGVRVSSLMIDSAGGGDNGQAAYEQRIADGWKANDAAYQQMRDRDADAWKHPPAASAAAVADQLAGEAKNVRDHAYAEAVAAGHSPDEANRHASYEAMKHRQSNAWRA